MENNSSISNTSSKWWLLVVLIIIAAGVGIGLSVSKDDSDSSTSSSNNISRTLPITNNFSSTLEGSDQNFKNSFNFVEDVKRATDNISDILLENEIVPIKFIIIEGSDGNGIAFAHKTNTDLRSGGTIYIYSDFSHNLSVSYVEILMHEILHVMGIGLHSKWRNASSNNKLDGSEFPNALEEYNRLTGQKNTYIPLGNAHGHWQESKFGDEMMTPYIAGANDLKFSKLTGKALQDLGWNINFNSTQFENYTI